MEKKDRTNPCPYTGERGFSKRALILWEKGKPTKSRKGGSEDNVARGIKKKREKNRPNLRNRPLEKKGTSGWRGEYVVGGKKIGRRGELLRRLY